METLTELEALFEWHPPPLKLAEVHMGGSRSKSSRPPSFYDKHIAPHLICKELVHVPNLHKKIASVVDQKLEALYDPYGQLMLPAPAPTDLYPTGLRDARSREMDDGIKDEKGVVEFYLRTTGEFCVRVASTIALHPSQWTTVLTWSASTSQRSHAICDGSLQVRSYDPWMEGLMTTELLEALMEIRERYRDLATWEMKSLTVGNGDVMLKIMEMVASGEEFSWSTCAGDECGERKGRNKHRMHNPRRGEDAPETLEFFTAPWTESDPTDAFIAVGSHDSQSAQPMNEHIDDILNCALRRAGSSLDIAREFNRQLEEDGRKGRSRSPRKLNAQPAGSGGSFSTARQSSPSKVRFEEPEDTSPRSNSKKKRKRRSQPEVPKVPAVTARSFIQQVSNSMGWFAFESY
jgi:hypothetical protein